MKRKIISRVAAVSLLIAATTANGQILSFTSRPEKAEYEFSEPIEVVSQVAVSSGSRWVQCPDGITSNVAYDVEYISQGTFSPVPEAFVGASNPGPGWAAKLAEVSVGKPLVATMDLRILYRLQQAGWYRVRGKYRLINHARSFDMVAEWKEFEIRPPTQREGAMSRELELAAEGATDSDKLGNYETFLAKYPDEFITGQAYAEMLRIYERQGKDEDSVALCKRIIGNQNISKVQRRLLAYTIGTKEEARGRLDEAVRWYRQCDMQAGDRRAGRLKRKGE